jgi:hypothetical protein
MNCLLIPWNYHIGTVNKLRHECHMITTTIRPIAGAHCEASPCNSSSSSSPPLETHFGLVRQKNGKPLFCLKVRSHKHCRENLRSILPGDKGRPAREADNLTAECELIV